MKPNSSNTMSLLKTSLIALTTGILFSCSSTDKKNDKIHSTNFKTKDTSISFAGNWLSKAYFESINTLKSPKEAQDNSAFIFIPDRTLKQTVMIENFHEGGPTLTILKNVDQYELWEEQNDSLTQFLDKIQIIDTNKIKISNRLFVRIYPLKHENDPLILESVLFKGIYTDNKGARIEFKNNGEVSGLDNFKIYAPMIDYMDAGREVDQVGLGTNKNDLEYYGFKFNKDTLELFNLNCLTFDSINNRCVEVELGKQTHKLWKKDSY